MLYRDCASVQIAVPCQEWIPVGIVARLYAAVCAGAVLQQHALENGAIPAYDKMCGFMAHRVILEELRHLRSSLIAAARRLMVYDRQVTRRYPGQGIRKHPCGICDNEIKRPRIICNGHSFFTSCTGTGKGCDTCACSWTIVRAVSCATPLATTTPCWKRVAAPELPISRVNKARIKGGIGWLLIVSQPITKRQQTPARTSRTLKGVHF